MGLGMNCTGALENWAHWKWKQKTKKEKLRIKLLLLKMGKLRISSIFMIFLKKRILSFFEFLIFFLTKKKTTRDLISMRSRALHYHGMWEKWNAGKKTNSNKCSVITQQLN